MKDDIERRLGIEKPFPHEFVVGILAARAIAIERAIEALNLSVLNSRDGLRIVPHEDRRLAIGRMRQHEPAVLRLLEIEYRFLDGARHDDGSAFANAAQRAGAGLRIVDMLQHMTAPDVIPR